MMLPSSCLENPTLVVVFLVSFLTPSSDLAYIYMHREHNKCLDSIIQIVVLDH